MFVRRIPVIAATIVGAVVLSSPLLAGGKGGGKPGGGGPGGGEDPPVDAAPAIAFCQPAGGKGGYDLMVMDADGGNVTTVLKGASNWLFQPTWSPDGSQLAYCGTYGGVTGLYVLEADGSGHHRVLSGDVMAAAWSPQAIDGAEWIAFYARSATPGNTRSDIFVVPATGGTPVQVTDTAGADERYPTWHPDASALAFTCADFDAVRHDVKTVSIAAAEGGGLAISGTPTTLTSSGQLSGTTSGYASIDWSRDGTTVIASAWLSGANHADLWEIDARTAGTASQLTSSSDATERLPACSPSDHPGGAQIVFELEAKGSGLDGLYALDVDTGATTLLLGGDAALPSWKR